MNDEMQEVIERLASCVASERYAMNDEANSRTQRTMHKVAAQSFNDALNIISDVFRERAESVGVRIEREVGAAIVKRMTSA